MATVVRISRTETVEVIPYNVVGRFEATIKHKLDMLISVLLWNIFCVRQVVFVDDTRKHEHVTVLHNSLLKLLSTFTQLISSDASMVVIIYLVMDCHMCLLPNASMHSIHIMRIKRFVIQVLCNFWWLYHYTCAHRVKKNIVFDTERVDINRISPDNRMIWFYWSWKPMFLLHLACSQSSFSNSISGLMIYIDM